MTAPRNKPALDYTVGEPVELWRKGRPVASAKVASLWDDVSQWGNSEVGLILQVDPFEWNGTNYTGNLYRFVQQKDGGFLAHAKRLRSVGTVFLQAPSPNKASDEVGIPAEPAEGRPSYEQIRAALILASKALNYIGIDSWEMECLGDDLTKIDAMAERAEANP